MAYYTSKYSGEEIDALLDKISATVTNLAASNDELTRTVQEQEARILKLEGGTT